MVSSELSICGRLCFILCHRYGPVLSLNPFTVHISRCYQHKYSKLVVCINRTIYWLIQWSGWNRCRFYCLKYYAIEIIQNRIVENVEIDAEKIGSNQIDRRQISHSFIGMEEYRSFN